MQPEPVPDSPPPPRSGIAKWIVYVLGDVAAIAHAAGRAWDELCWLRLALRHVLVVTGSVHLAVLLDARLYP